MKLALAAAAVVLIAPLSLRATVEEQRARLPPPARCQDPVQGVWRALKHNPTYGYWTLLTLSVRRAAGSPTLTGAIESRAWTGGPDQSEPPRCGLRVKDWTVEMPATGRYDEATRAIQFEGTSWRVRAVHCQPWSGFNLDRFAGTIDPTSEEFLSVHDDGAHIVNVATVFRRVACTPNERSRQPDVPPPLTRRRAGCGR